uniref:Trophoblast glycoprotein b n=1 Tax=Denticeps clupeoides TaxID=299321 RepID=A0AAY4AAG6_9TELE
VGVWTMRRAQVPGKVLPLCALLLAAAAAPSSACPDGCVCSGATVKCADPRLRALPRPLPGDTRTLFVSGGDVARLAADSFPAPLPRLTEVHLTGSRVERVEALAFHNLPGLELLDLSNNSIRTFSPDALRADNALLRLNLSASLHNGSCVQDISGLLRGGTPRLSELDMSANDLLFLPDGMFSELANLSFLDLRNNSIVAIGGGALSVPAVATVDLRDNSLRNLPNRTIMDFRQSPGLRLLLAKNPWLCDCDLEDTLVWLRSTDQVLDKQNVTCGSPEKLRRHSVLLIEQLPCSYPVDSLPETSYVFLGMVLALIGLIFLLVLYLNRKGIKRWVYNIRDACRDHMEGYHYRYEVSSDPRLANLSLNSDV